MLESPLAFPLSRCASPTCTTAATSLLWGFLSPIAASRPSGLVSGTECGTITYQIVVAEYVGNMYMDVHEYSMYTVRYITFMRNINLVWSIWMVPDSTVVCLYIGDVCEASCSIACCTHLSPLLFSTTQCAHLVGACMHCMQ